MKTIKLKTLVLLLFAAVSWGCQGPEEKEEARNTTTIPVLQNADDASGIQLTLDGINGETIKLSDFADRVVLIDVWDTWCSPCKKGIPEFIEIYKEYKDKGVVILGIAGGRLGREAVKDFVEEYGMTYPVAMISRSVMEQLGSIEAIPTAFLLDRKHKVVKKYVGYHPKSDFIADINSVLK